MNRYFLARLKNEFLLNLAFVCISLVFNKCWNVLDNQRLRHRHSRKIDKDLTIRSSF